MSASSLPPHARAVFATSARLISCLVTESLARALYLPLPDSAAPAIALAVVLNGHVSANPPGEVAEYAPGDVFALVPLKHVPVFKHDSADPRATEIGLLDPLDMLPIILLINTGSDAVEDVPAEVL